MPVPFVPFCPNIIQIQCHPIYLLIHPYPSNLFKSHVVRSGPGAAVTRTNLKGQFQRHSRSPNCWYAGQKAGCLKIGEPKINWSIGPYFPCFMAVLGNASHFHSCFGYNQLVSHNLSSSALCACGRVELPGLPLALMGPKWSCFCRKWW